MTRLEYYIIQSQFVQSIIKWLRNIFLPGFEGVSLYDSLNFFRKEIFSNRFYTRASAVSFSFLMAMPPLLLFFFSLVPYLPLPEGKIIATITEMLNILSPNDKMKLSVGKLIRDFITHKKTVLLSFSVLLTLFYSSNGMMGLLNTFQKKLPGFKQKKGIQLRLYSILLTLLLIALILLALFLMILQSWVVESLHIDFLQNSFFLKFVTYTLVVLLCFFIVSMIYRYGITTEKRFKLISPGSIIATFLIILTTTIFFYAVNNLVNYDKIYGSIGTLIIFMAWVNFIAQILLIGFELNSSIVVNRKPKL
jgi:membrane protein